MKQEAAQDVSDQEEEEVTKKGGKKPKKSKKVKADESESETEETSAVKKGPAREPKKSRKDKKKAGSDVDDSEQLEAKPISAFALLQDDSDASDDGGGIKSDSETETKSKQSKKSKKKEADGEAAATGGKKGKKQKKPKRGASDDEEDLDKMLAELQLEYAGVKKPEEPKTAKKDTKPETPAVVEPEGSKKSKKKKKPAAAAEDDKPEVTPAPVEATPVATDTPAEAAETEATAGPKKKKGPGKAMVAAMQEALKKKREDDEEAQRREEEKIRLLEEGDKLREENARIEAEKKEKKKQKEKERKERLKAEGKLLTQKQKLDKARAASMLESYKALGIQVPDTTEKKTRPGTRDRSGKSKPQPKKEEEVAVVVPEVVAAVPEVVEPAEEKSIEEPEEVVPEPEPEAIPDAWDADSEAEEDTSKKQPAKKAEPLKKVEAAAKKVEQVKKLEAAKKQESVEESESESESSEDGSSSEDESSEEDTRTEAEKLRERAMTRIRKREAEAETKRTLENLRAAVVCVLGHVDTGKTKILDKLRRTNVQDGEAGGITQQIGATNVPIENIKDNTKHCKNYQEMVFKLPGLLIIDTPGHESFSNLRSRGSSLCDIAILVVDIMHGLEPQTIESLNLLKSRKTPFVVALNKIDRLYDWMTMPRKDIRDIIKGQGQNTQNEFQKRLSEVVVQFNEQGMNAALFYDNPDPRTYISLVPTSAISGEGMGNLLMLIIQFSQNQLAKRLMYSETLQATVLEVKAIPGLGTTIDAILINGKLREGDTMILAGTEGPIVTQVKALLMPQPMKELRVKNAYIEFKEIPAAQGVKIAAKELEKAIAGINLQIAQKPDEVEIYK